MCAQPDREVRSAAFGVDHPWVAVDTAVLTLDAEFGMSVLLVHKSMWDREPASEWRLPGMFIEPGETLEAAALRALALKAGIQGLHPRQLRVFDEPDRDARGWTISVAHVDVVRRSRIRLQPHTRIFPVTELPQLDFDHREIIELSVGRVREGYRAHPDPYRLLSDPLFTIRDLRKLHERVLGEDLNPDTFRRLMIPELIPTEEKRSGVRGKPALLYRHRDARRTAPPLSAAGP